MRRWILVGLLALAAGGDTGGDPAPEPQPPAADALGQVLALTATTSGDGGDVLRLR